jgi:hypothetical protein
VRGGNQFDYGISQPFPNILEKVAALQEWALEPFVKEMSERNEKAPNPLASGPEHSLCIYVYIYEYEF